MDKLFTPCLSVHIFRIRDNLGNNARPYVQHSEVSLAGYYLRLSVKQLFFSTDVTCSDSALSPREKVLIAVTVVFGIIIIALALTVVVLGSVLSKKKSELNNLAMKQ